MYQSYLLTTNAIVQTLVNYDIYNRMGLDYFKQQEKKPTTLLSVYAIHEKRSFRTDFSTE